MAKRKPRRRKHVPMRTCIACRQTRAKRDLIRIVRTPTDGIQVDPTGKLAGRGAYLCRTRACWQKALQSNILASALKTEIDQDDIARLEAYGATLPEEGPLSDDGATPSKEVSSRSEA